MSDWRKCYLGYKDNDVYWQDADSCWILDENATESELNELKEKCGQVHETMYDASNWKIFSGEAVANIHTPHFSYLYNSFKPKYPVKDTKFPVYVNFGKSDKAGKDFTLDMSEYTCELSSIFAPFMFRQCSAGKIIGLSKLPQLDSYSDMFRSAGNITYLNLRGVNFYAMEGGGNCLEVSEYNRCFLRDCKSLVGLDLSEVHFGNSEFLVKLASYMDRLTSGDWKSEDEYYWDIVGFSNTDLRFNASITFISPSPNLYHVNLYGADGDLFSILESLCYAATISSPVGRVLNIYVSDRDYLTVLDYMYVLSRHTVFCTRDDSSVGKVRILPVKEKNGWRKYRNSGVSTEGLGRVFSFHTKGYWEGSSAVSDLQQEVKFLLGKGMSDSDITKTLGDKYDIAQVLSTLHAMGSGYNLVTAYCSKTIVPSIKCGLELDDSGKSSRTIWEVVDSLCLQFPRVLVNESIVMYLRNQYVIEW